MRAYRGLPFHIVYNRDVGSPDEVRHSVVEVGQCERTVPRVDGQCTGHAVKTSDQFRKLIMTGTMLFLAVLLRVYMKSLS